MTTGGEATLVGRNLGPLQITSRLGTGAMGIVYRAQHHVHGDVCVKVLAPEFRARGDMLRRFQREAEAARRLNHPHVVRGYGIEETDGQQYLIQEFVPGGDLQTYIGQFNGPMPLPTALRIAREIARGLSAAHAEGLVHRDLKPQNVLLDANGRAKIADLGLVLQVDGEPLDGQTILTKKGQALGTPYYMAPEQWRGAHDVDARADLYALGVMLYLMLSGRRPFKADSISGLMRAHLKEQVLPVRSYAVEVPPSVDKLVLELLEKEPEGRPASAADVANRITESARELGIVNEVCGAEGPDQTVVQAMTPGPQAGATDPEGFVGQVIAGKLEVRSVIGRGGMGVVLHARHQLLDQDFAVKVIHAAFAKQEEFRLRFLREAKALTAFVHKNAVTLRDFGEHDGSLYMAMDYVDGQTLRAVLKNGPPFDQARALGLAQQVLPCLQDAHEASLVHRDLKPDNIMIERDGRVRVLDFGIAKMLQDASRNAQSSDLTGTGVSIGTPHYMSPEQDAGDPVDARSDVYSFACVLYEAISGRRPLEAETQRKLHYKIQMEAPDPLSAASGGRIGEPFAQVIMQALGKDPDVRPPSAAAFLAQLQQAAGVAARSVGSSSALAVLAPAVGGRPGSSGTLPSQVRTDPGATTGAPGAPAAALPAEPAPDDADGGGGGGGLAVIVIVTVLLLVAGVAAGGIAFWLRNRKQPTPTPTPSPTPAPVPTPTGPVAFAELDPPAGAPVLLREPVLSVAGRVSGGASSILITRPGKLPVLTQPLDAEGRFERRIELPPEGGAVELRAGDPPAIATIETVIDAAAPTVSLEVPAQWKKGEPLPVSATVSDDHPKLVRFRLLVDGEPSGEPIEKQVSGSGASASFTVPDGAGSIQVVAEAEDRVGLTGEASRVVPIESARPAIAITAPAADAVTRAKTLAVAATVANARGEASVVLLRGETELSRRTAPIAATGEVRVPDLALPDEDGPVRVVVSVKDEQGEVVQTREALVDRTPPSVELLSPAGDTVTREASVEVRVKVRDADRVARVSRDGEPLRADGETWTGTWRLPGEGRTTATLVVADRAGNEASVPVPVTVDRTAPRVRLVEPTGIEPTNRKVIDIVVDANDDHGIASVALERTKIALVRENGAWRGRWEMTKDGRVADEVVVTDRAGNRTKVGIEVTVDVTAPTVTLAASSLSADAAGKVTVAGTVSELCREARVGNTRLRLDGNAFSGEVAVPYGENAYEVVATDRVGNQSAPVTVSVSRPIAPAGTWWEPTAEQKAHVQETGVPLWFENGKGMRMVLLPPGSFAMGSPNTEDGHEDDETIHQVVHTQAIWVADAEVTNAQYRRYVRSHRSGAFKGTSLDEDEKPAVQVSWEDAEKFCRWLSREEGTTYRLLTEAEWERMARAGTRTPRFWGADLQDAHRYANANDPATIRALSFAWDGWPRDDGHRVSAPVRSYQPNQLGLHDVIGNVWEWCADFYAPLPTTEQVDPLGPSFGKNKVVRGGAWSVPPALCRSAYRFWLEPKTRLPNVGFRVCTESPPRGR